MNIKRQFFIYIATALFCICSLPAAAAKAAAAPSLYAESDKSAAAGQDTVSIRISIAGNPAISTWKAALAYDSSIFQYEGSSWSSSLSESDMKIASDTGRAVNLTVISSDSYAADGSIVTVRFRAVQDTDSIPVTLALQEMTDTDMEQISDCRVYSTVRVPETGNSAGNEAGAAESTAGSESDTAGNETDSGEDIAENEADKAGNGEGTAESEADTAGNGADTAESEADTAGNQADSGESLADGEADAAEGGVETETGSVTESGAGTDSSAGTADETGSIPGTGDWMQNGERSDNSGSQPVRKGESDGIRRQQNVRMAQTATAGTGSARADESYVTGAGIGKDIFLLLAAVCGILALAVFCRKNS